MQANVDGKSYEIVHYFSNKRAIIDFDGAFVLVDHVQNEDWELSGNPAMENEKPILAAFLAPMMDKTILTVTPPDE
jgi:hypothetical protein